MWPDQELQADHEIPRALGGGGILRWAHRSCNARAGAKVRAIIQERKRAKEPPDWMSRWA
jgi:hypothetical protein